MYSPRPLALRQLDERFHNLRPQDFAYWGAYLLEDIGIMEIDRAVGDVAVYGKQIRDELTGGGNSLAPNWAEVATRLWTMSPALSSPHSMLSVMCQLACAKLVIEDRLNAKEAK